MTKEQEYYKAKEALKEASLKLEKVSRPQLDDTGLIFQMYEIFALRRGGMMSSSDREEFIACMLLLYSPLTIWEDERCPRGINRAISNALDVTKEGEQ